jgi:hypothetical protein
VKKIFGSGTFQVGWSATANKQYFILGLVSTCMCCGFIIYAVVQYYTCVLWLHYPVLWFHYYVLWFHYYMLLFHYYVLCFHHFVLWFHYYTPRNEVRGVYWNQSVCLSVRLSVDTKLYLLILLGLCMDFDETLHTCYTWYDLVSPGMPLCSAIFSRVMTLDISK